MDRDIWIQLENHPWDITPNKIDRMTGEDKGHITIKDALILRRYTENWAKPDDRKVNPWDLNEPVPTDNGTMGTIPGPVIECDVGDKVIVHFRNKDNREGVNILHRLHSLHTHGFVFNIVHDGAYPLSPPDPNQPVGAESDLWKDINKSPASDFKRGDRVPPGGTFNYIWNTLGWPTTAGVWLYHDHSVCDMENVQLGAIGIVVIHNPNDTENDVFNPDLPGGSNIGSPKDEQGLSIDPPTQARYLVLLHEVEGGYMCMNGRWKLGNAPTFVAGLNTKMRFGVVAMGDMAHTFHIHGHRWVIHGPDGIHAGDIERSIQNRSVSQFEDTRIMGAANSFNFTIKQGSFMGSLFPVDPTQAPGLGEWHMHCHIPSHMMNGMMGSLLVVNKGTKIDIDDLQHGVPCPHDDGGSPPATVTVDHFAFEPTELTVPSGTEVTFDFQQAGHTVMTDSTTNDAHPININNGGGDTDAILDVPKTIKVTIEGKSGEIRYRCGIHASMKGIIRISDDGGHGGGHGGGHS
jgi:plastocyanin